MADVPTDTASSENTSLLPDPDAETLSAINSELEMALDLVSQGKQEDAFQLCMTILGRENLPVRSASTLSLILRRLGRTDIADKIKAVVLLGVRANKAHMQNSVAALLPTAEALVDLEAFDDAEELSRRALEIAPNDPNVVLSLSAFLLQRSREAEAETLAQEFCERVGQNFDVLLQMSLLFAHFKADAVSARFLEFAKDHCKTEAQRTKLNYRLAAIGQPVEDLDQQQMAVDLFDGFAESYDKKLTALGNNGPNLVLTALEELRLDKTKTRRILDAGCGTGLCAGFLRDYGQEIVGVDLSVKMLEQAQAKGVYDFLARTDLALPQTYPEGTFDMIVSADVLVYFGALDTVFKNYFNVLNPGGWLVFTVEDEAESEAEEGFKLYPSSRYKHKDSYLVRTLTEVGFQKPKLLEKGRLRNEMTEPVLATVVAVQK